MILQTCDHKELNPHAPKLDDTIYGNFTMIRDSV